MVTPLAGIQAALEGQADVLQDNGSDPERAVATARVADAVVLIVGYTHNDEGEFLDPSTMQKLAALFPPPTPEEAPAAQRYLQDVAGQPANAILTGGDRDRLTLHTEDEQLIRAVAAANPRTIVAIMSGSCVLMESWRERVPAILMLWYPGMEGGHALADVLLGRVNPSGKLPFVVPRRAEDLPFFDKNATEIEYDLWHGYRKLERDSILPAFPFGFGLSYTRYRYSNLKLARNRLGSSDTLRINLDVSNIGAHAGEEVVQLYVSPIGSAVERAPKELKAFTRIALQPGETKTVHLDVPVSRLAYYDESKADFVVEPLEYELAVGAHSLDRQALKARFVVRNG